MFPTYVAYPSFRENVIKSVKCVIFTSIFTLHKIYIISIILYNVKPGILTIVLRRVPTSQPRTPIPNPSPCCCHCRPSGISCNPSSSPASFSSSLFQLFTFPVEIPFVPVFFSSACLAVNFSIIFSLSYSLSFVYCSYSCSFFTFSDIDPFLYYV